MSPLGGIHDGDATARLTRYCIASDGGSERLVLNAALRAYIRLSTWSQKHDHLAELGSASDFLELALDLPKRCVIVLNMRNLRLGDI